MRNTTNAARGKWRGILMHFGLSKDVLSGKHCACPMCGGKDRFRWDNKDGNGTFICNQCGAGNGIDLVMLLKGWEFKQAADEVDRICGNVSVEAAPRKLEDDRRVKLLNDLWLKSSEITRGDEVCQYFEGRGFPLQARPDVLRFCQSCRAPDGNDYPAMVAMVMDAMGAPVNLHRTFLVGGKKAEIDTPRALMPGTVPDGSAIRLWGLGEHLGVAEGIETAHAAHSRFGIPVWSTINATLLAKWMPPEGVKRVTVFGDNDAKLGGQAAAYTLAHRLAVRGLEVDVQIPQQVNTDWADAA